jgi:hypothetical protein
VVTPNQEIAAEALNNAPLMPAEPADTSVGPAVMPPATVDPTVPAVADPTAPIVPATETPDEPEDSTAGQSGML